MAIRSSWKGYLKLSLVSVPVQAVNAVVSGGGEIHFHQLHAACHSRIRYQKVCPIHGEVSKEEIVSGYEYAKGKYTIIDPDEIDELLGENDRSVTIDQFIEPEELDVTYFDGRTYYLLPDGPVGQKPYAVLHDAMKDKRRYGLARVMLSGKDQLGLVRSLNGMIAVSMLHFDAQIRKPQSLESELVAQKISDQELKLAEMLIDASTAEEFDYSKYEDTYTKRLTELINAKVEGKEVVAPPHEEETSVINLMDALKQSLGRAQKGGAREAKAAPKKKMAPSKPRTAARRRKSS